MLTLLLALPPLLLQDKPLILGEGTHEFEVTLEHPVETLESLFQDQPGVDLLEGQRWPLGAQDHHPLAPRNAGIPILPDQASVLRIPFRVSRSGRWSLRLEAITFDAALAVREPQQGYLAIDDDGWYALNPLLPELKLRKGTDYELLILAVGFGTGQVTLHAQRQPFDWTEHARALIEDRFPNLRLMESSKKNWKIVLEDGTQQSPEAWSRDVLEKESGSLRILALENLAQSKEPNTWLALQTYGNLLSLRGWQEQPGYFGRIPSWDSYWEEVRAAFLGAMKLLVEEHGADSPLFMANTLKAGRSEMYFRAAGDYEGAAKIVQASMRMYLEEFGELSGWSVFFPLELGALLHWSGKKIEAVRELRRGLSLQDDPQGKDVFQKENHWTTYTMTAFHLGKVLDELGDKEGALEAYEKASSGYEPLRAYITGNPKVSISQWFQMTNAITVVTPSFAMHRTALPGLKQFREKYHAEIQTQANPNGVHIDYLDWISQPLSYFSATEANLASLYAQRGDLLSARKHLMEALGGSWIRVREDGTLLELVAKNPNNRILDSACQVILDGIQVAQGLGDQPMEICLVFRAPSMCREMEALTEKIGWLPSHELALQFLRLLMNENVTSQHFTAATEQYRWDDPGPWADVTRQQRWQATLHFSKFLVADLNPRLNKRLLAFDHPKVQEVHLWVKAACELLGEPYPTELEIRDPDRKQVPPALTLWSPTSGSLPASKTTFTVEGWLDDPAGLPDLHWRLDDGPWARLSDMEDGKRGNLRRPEQEGRWRFRFPLALAKTRGVTKLELRAVSTSGLEGTSQEIKLEYQAGSRNLYVLAFGVADYESDALDLQWPVKDAEDVAAALSGQSDLFDEVKVEVLRNAEVTSAELQRRLKSTLRQAGPDDTIVVFGAGHGIRDEDGEYWFLTADATPEDPYSGVSRHVLERLVTWSQLKSNRRILLLDTCQSGRGAADEASRGASGLFSSRDMDAALAGTGGGVYILAGSTEAGSALEAGGNGLFTAGILAALRGEGDTDGNGQVTVEELRAFVVQFVETKTDGRQRPTFPLIEGGEDFPLTASGQ